MAEQARPVYMWTTVLPIRAYDAAGESAPLLGGERAVLAYPSGRYQDGWAESAIEAERPGTPCGATNFARLQHFTEPLDMASGLGLATTVEGLWAYPDVVRLPRPLEGEDADGTASYVVLAVATDEQRVAIEAEDPAISWYAALPDAP